MSVKQPLEFISNRVCTPPRKRLYMGLVVGICIIFCLLLVLGWLIPYFGLSGIHPALPVILGVLFGLCILGIGLAGLALGIQSLRGRPFQGADWFRSLSTKVFLPLAEFSGRILRVSPDEVRRSFIKVNNELALSHAGRLTARDVLILLPHCIQHTGCPVRLTHNVDACERCGRCPLAALLQIRDEYGVKLAVATGGSIARLIVVEARPRLILAVACERDLAAGIRDTSPLPVFGILNERPEGPCRNTTVAIDLVRESLDRFLGEKSAAGRVG